MKKTLLSLILLTSLSSYFAQAQANEACPSEWPVTLSQKVGSTNEFKIRVISALIKNEDSLGDKEWEISSEYWTYVQIKGNIVVGSFVTTTEPKAEKWIDIGHIETTQTVESRTCFKLQTPKNISFVEIKERSRADCFPLPKWMCGKNTYKTLQLETRMDGETYILKAQSGILKD